MWLAWPWAFNASSERDSFAASSARARSTGEATAGTIAKNCASTACGAASAAGGARGNEGRKAVVHLPSAVGTRDGLGRVTMAGGIDGRSEKLARRGRVIYNGIAHPYSIRSLRVREMHTTAAPKAPARTGTVRC
jgi:hypothetical protein